MTVKIALGTAQFGLDYGISNVSGRVDIDEVRRILNMAADAGVCVIDTAAAYGKAEHVLGEILPAGHNFRLVTKLSSVIPETSTATLTTWIRDALMSSLQRLRTNSIYGLLVHNAQALLSSRGDDLWNILEGLRKCGFVQKIGVSIYTGEEVDALLSRYPLELVQLPISVLDQRLIASGHLARLKTRGVEIHARSLLLQGLLLMHPTELPMPYFNSLRSGLHSFHAAAEQRGLSPLEAAVSFANSVPEIDAAIFGVTRPAELVEIFAATKRSLPPAWYQRFALNDAEILNPARWPTFR